MDSCNLKEGLLVLAVCKMAETEQKSNSIMYLGLYKGNVDPFMDVKRLKRLIDLFIQCFTLKHDAPFLFKRKSSTWYMELEYSVFIRV